MGSGGGEKWIDLELGIWVVKLIVDGMVMGMREGSDLSIWVDRGVVYRDGMIGG